MIISSKKRPQVGTVGLYALSLSLSQMRSLTKYGTRSLSQKNSKRRLFRFPSKSKSRKLKRLRNKQQETAFSASKIYFFKFLRNMTSTYLLF